MKEVQAKGVFYTDNTKRDRLVFCIPLGVAKAIPKGSAIPVCTIPPFTQITSCKQYIDLEKNELVVVIETAGLIEVNLQ